MFVIEEIILKETCMHLFYVKNAYILCKNIAYEILLYKKHILFLGKSKLISITYSIHILYLKIIKNLYIAHFLFLLSKSVYHVLYMILYILLYSKSHYF